MNIINFADLLEAVSTEKQAEVLLNKYLETYGFRSYAFTYYSGHVKSGRKLRYSCVSQDLRAWHNHYLEQNYADIDRTLEETYLTTLPLFWDVNEQLAQAKSLREKRIRQESIEFGINKGLSISIYGPQHDFVSLVLHQRKNETNLIDYIKHQWEWLSATHLYYHCIKKQLILRKAYISPFKLTRREEQCLTLTAKSYRVEQIAKELKISPRTVNFHIQNANKKLGTNNKYQAIRQYF
jgi:DNA-binding CsgD family transcriptional regulator